MKNTGKILIFIVVFQLLIILFAIMGIINGVQNDDLIDNQSIYPDFETWSESNYNGIPWYPDYYQEFKDTEWLITNIYILAVTPIAIAGCIGLVMRKNWGRALSILSMGMTILFFILLMVSFSLRQETSISEIGFVDIIAAVLISQAFIVLSILSSLYLTKSHVKELFKSKTYT